MSVLLTNLSQASPIFNVYRDNDYPYDSYTFSPITDNTKLPTQINNKLANNDWSTLDGGINNAGTSGSGSMITYQFLNYNKNPYSSIVKYSDANYSRYIQYGSTASQESPNLVLRSNSSKFIVSKDVVNPSGVFYIERPNVITFYNTSTVTINFPHIRQDLNTAYEFYFFSVQVQDPTTTDPTMDSYGFMLYPRKLFLNPVAIKNNNGNWQLSAKLCLLDSYVYHFHSKNITNDAFNYYLNNLNSLPNVIYDLSSLTNYNLQIALYATQTFVDYPVLNTAYNQSFSKNLIFQTVTGCFLDPESVFISYSGNYVNSIDGSTGHPLVQQQRNINQFFNSQQFSPSYIYNYNFQTQQQNFQLLQGFSGTFPSTADFSSTQYCILSCTVSNNGTATGLPVSINSNNSVLKTVNLNNLNIDFVTNSTNFAGVGTNVFDTIVSTKIGGVNTPLYTGNAYSNSPVNINIGSKLDSNHNFGIIEFDLQYPPFFYSYKTYLSDPNLNSGLTLVDTNSLNFYMALCAMNVTQNTATLKPYIASDFNSLIYEIQQDSNNGNAGIVYTLIASYPMKIDDALAALRCVYYKNNQAVNYVLGDQIDLAQSDGSLSITLTNTPQVSSFAGSTLLFKGSYQDTRYGTIDSYQSTDVTFLLPPQPNNDIFIDILEEGSNQIKIDSSFNVVLTAWPYKDLTNSNIYWYTNSTDPLVFNYIDQNGNTIAPVNGPAPFSNKTWQVQLSGYGPNQVVISLSSDKYPGIVSLSTNPSLYDFLSERRLVVGPSIQLNNDNITRTITLTAGIPYGNKVFTIPSYIPISWSWEYDNNSDPELQPITANYNGIPYYYNVDTKSGLASSMNFKITPGYSKTTPLNHKVTVYANINTVQPPITGSYTFNVDDFPDSTIFNADFNLYYSDFINSNFNIASTRDQNNIVTRPNTSILNFTTSANNDIIPTLNLVSSAWSINGSNVSYSNSYNLSLNSTNLTLTSLNGFSVSTLKISYTISGYAPGWASAHNTTSDCYFYILSSTDFYHPLQFIIYPEYAWITNNKYVTLLQPNGTNVYTLSYRPSAYLNKKSNSQTWWVSANKNCFTEYLYQNQENYSIVATVSSYALIDLSYDPNDPSVIYGIPISLNAYNNTFYPENLNISYIDEILSSNVQTTDQVIAINASNSLIKANHTISTQTKSGNPTTNTIQNFFLSPILLNYSDVMVNSDFYSLNSDGNYYPIQGMLDVDTDGQIYANLFVDTIPANQPSEISNVSITYYLSTNYWVASSYIDSSTIVTGTTSWQPIFNLQYGDPSVLLNTGTEGVSHFHLYYTINLQQQIPPSVFDLVTPPYSNPDLWNVINVIA
jgi:hypothetical protein